MSSIPWEHYIHKNEKTDTAGWNSSVNGSLSDSWDFSQRDPQGLCCQELKSYTVKVCQFNLVTCSLGCKDRASLKSPVWQGWTRIMPEENMQDGPVLHQDLVRIISHKMWNFQKPLRHGLVFLSQIQLKNGQLESCVENAMCKDIHWIGWSHWQVFRLLLLSPQTHAYFQRQIENSRHQYSS